MSAEHTATIDPALAPAAEPPAAPRLAAPVVCIRCGQNRHAAWGLTRCAGCGHEPDAANTAIATAPEAA